MVADGQFRGRPMTDRLATGVVPELVGRADALRRIGRALGQGPALVVVEGEAGIGKTSLLRRALADAEMDTAGVLVATCPAVAEPAPLGAVVAAVRRSAADVAGLGLSDLAGALRPLFPEWGASLPPAPEPLDEPSAVRHRVYRALTELVDRLGVRVLVLEDAHWADPATLEWLLTLSVQAHGMSLVVSFRPWDVPPESLLPRLTGRAVPGRSRVRVELRPLDNVQVGQFVRSVYGRNDIDEGLITFLCDVTDGIPLVLEEYLLLLEDRDDTTDGWGIGRTIAELTVPTGVRESVLERVHRLDADTRGVLVAISVLGDPADEPLVAAVAGLVPGRAASGVATALARGLLREHSAGLFAFRHIIDAQAVSESLPVSERRRLHARAGRELRRRDHAPVGRLAHHFREAGDTEQWATYAEASARVAVESGDDRTAVETLLAVLDAPGITVEQQARLAKPLCQAAFFGAPGLVGLTNRVVEVLTRLLDSGQIPPAERGELRLHLGRVLCRAGEWTSGFEQFERAVDDLGERPDLAIRAMSNLALPMVTGWPVDRHRYWLDRACELLDRVPPLERRAVRRLHAMALLLCGDAEGWEIVRALPPASSVRAEQFQFAAHRMNLALAMLVWGRYGDAAAELDAARRYLEETGDSGRHHSLRARQAKLDWYLGHWTGLLERAGEVATAADAVSESRRSACEVRALLRLATGARSLAERSLRRIVDEVGRSGTVHPESVSVSAALARLHLSDGDADAALSITCRAVDLISTKNIWLWVTDIAGVHVDALLATGRGQEAVDFVDSFAGWLRDRDHDLPAPAAGLLTCRGILEAGIGTDTERAVELFDRSAASWATLPRPYDELLTRERQGRALLTAGRQESALALLSATQQRMRDLGARWDADRVAKLVRGHGQAVARTWRGGRRGYGDRLSPRQIDVIRLVARGLTNRQVAERLFLSTRTVEGHVTSAMRKLGAPSRTALVVAAVEAGLIDADHDTWAAHE